jgi:CRP-like cAMP-binding protein
MFVASMIFAATLSFFTNASKFLFNDEVERRVADAIRFMRRRDIPEALQRRVQHNLRHRLQQDKQDNQQDLLKLLSPAVQRDLSLGLLNTTVLHFPLFKDAQHAFVAELAQAHTWVMCLPGDCVASRGQAVQEIVFLTRGDLLARFDKATRHHYLDVGITQLGCDDSESVVNYEGGDSDALSNNQGDAGHSSARSSFSEKLKSAGRSSAPRPDLTDEVTIGMGAWFGESCLFDLEHIRAATIIAVSESELAVLTAANYMKVIEKYPRLLERHKDIQERIHDGTLDIRKLAYKPLHTVDGPVTPLF